MNHCQTQSVSLYSTFSIRLVLVLVLSFELRIKNISVSQYVTSFSRRNVLSCCRSLVQTLLVNKRIASLYPRTATEYECSCHASSTAYIVVCAPFQRSGRLKAITTRGQDRAQTAMSKNISEFWDGPQLVSR